MKRLRYSRFASSSPRTIDEAGVISIASGSEVGVIEVDGSVLGVGAVAPVRPGSVISLPSVRGRLADVMGSVPSVRRLEGGLPRIDEVGDSLELDLWPAGCPAAPARKRAPARYAAWIPGGSIQTQSIGLVNTGLRALRFGTDGRARGTLWIAPPYLELGEGEGPLEVLIRRRVYQGFVPLFAGTHAMHEQLVTRATNLSFNEDWASFEPIEFGVDGAQEVELLVGGGWATANHWLFAAEVEDA